MLRTPDGRHVPQATRVDGKIIAASHQQLVARDKAMSGETLAPSEAVLVANLLDAEPDDVQISEESRTFEASDTLTGPEVKVGDDEDSDTDDDKPVVKKTRGQGQGTQK